MKGPSMATKARMSFVCMTACWAVEYVWFLANVEVSEDCLFDKLFEETKKHWRNSMILYFALSHA